MNIRNAQSPTGVIDAVKVRQVFVHGLHITAALLMALSFIGTFYGSRGLDVPLLDPLRIVADLMRDGGVAAMALLAQAVLTLFQWGARQYAGNNPRWWALYAGALALSLWWNWHAYADPLLALGVPWLVTAGIIVLGDVFPELILVKD